MRPWHRWNETFSTKSKFLRISFKRNVAHQPKWLEWRGRRENSRVITVWYLNCPLSFFNFLIFRQDTLDIEQVESTVFVSGTLHWQSMHALCQHIRRLRRTTLATRREENQRRKLIKHWNWRFTPLTFRNGHGKRESHVAEMTISRNASLDRENYTQVPQFSRIMLLEDQLDAVNLKNASEENVRWSRWQFSVFRHIVVITCICGILLTGWVLTVILHNKKFRTIPNLYYVNIFISNLCAMVIGLAFELPALLMGKWPFNDTACQINLQLRRMFFTVTLAHFSFMALNRLFAICLSTRKCLVSRTAFIIQSFIAYGVPTAIHLFNAVVLPIKGSRVVYIEILDTCLLVTTTEGSVRYCTTIDNIRFVAEENFQEMYSPQQQVLSTKPVWSPQHESGSEAFNTKITFYHWLALFIVCRLRLFKTQTKKIAVITKAYISALHLRTGTSRFIRTTFRPLSLNLPNF